MDESTDIQEPIVSEDAERVLVAPEDRAAIRILVVDDEPSILESCENVLGGEGYGCQVERRGEEALRRLRRPMPMRPSPRRERVPGSGTAVAPPQTR